MKLPEEKYKLRAIAAFYRSLILNNSIPQQPSNDSGVREIKGKRYVVLKNANGILAVYRIRNDERLKRLRRWPVEIE